MHFSKPVYVLVDEFDAVTANLIRRQFENQKNRESFEDLKNSS